MNMDFVSMNLVTLMYLVASVCFIQALKGLSHPTTSIRGNVFGMTGMTIAVITTAALIVKLSGSGVGMSWVLWRWHDHGATRRDDQDARASGFHA
jgi:NAD(P) transhydrogenase subunit beta